MKKRGSSYWVFLVVLASLGCSGESPGNGSGGKRAGESGEGAAANGGGGSGGSFGDNPGSTGGTGSTGVLGDAAVADGAFDPDTDHCGSFSIETTIEKKEVPGNVLVVYDKSGSMNQAWKLPDGTDSTKLLASAKAFLDAIGPIATKINVGTVFFPSSGSCDVAALDSGAQIAMMPGPDYISAWVTYWMDKNANGNTPLLEGLTAADAALTSSTLTGTTVVLVITDGDPNCGWNATTANGLVAKWLGTGVKTYVIGLPGTTGTGDMILTDLAAAGGTTTFIKTTDSMTLQTEIAKIATETVTSMPITCTIKLDPAPPDPELVQMVAIENGVKASVPRMINADAGWTINAAGTEVELEGLLCRDAKNGRFEKLTFQYGCPELPPIEPPVVE